MTRCRWLALGLLIAGLAPGPAAAQTERPSHPEALARRQATYVWDRDLLRASFSYRDILSDPALVKKLASGLPMVVAMRAYVFRAGSDAPIALVPRVCRVVYDLWDEVYRVHVTEPESDTDKAVLLEGVLRNCLDPRDLPVMRRVAVIPGERYFLGVVVDVNPVSPAMVEQMRRWMSRPTGSTGILPTDALFGNFVQLFVHQVATSDKTLTFRTQDVAL